MKYILIILLGVLLVVRMMGMSTIPNGFSWDEMDNAYQAYSLLKTGKDIFGNPLPVLLHAFADYKSSLYIYMTTPMVKLWGPTSLAARLPAAIFGMLAILTLVYLIGKRTTLSWGLVAGLLMGISPWWFHYSRLSFEAVGMLTFFLIGLAALEKALTKNSRYLVLAGLFWGLSIWTYSTAKLFVPLFGLIVLILYWHRIWQVNKLVLTLAAVITAIVCAPPIWQSFFGNGNTRFNEISIFTDPTTNSEIKYALETSQIASGQSKVVGLRPRLIDRLAHNKVEYWASRLTNNYLAAFSTDFLFVKGDPNLRQSPGINNIGELLPLDAALLLLGLIVLAKRKNSLLYIWLTLAPLPAIVTRDGAGHATRLLFMLPALIIFTVAGLKTLARYPIIAIIFLLFYSYGIFSSVYYYFDDYRSESAIPFQWGYDQVVNVALNNQTHYDRIVLDMHNDSALMAYLTYSKYPPAQLQAAEPLSQPEVIPGITGNKFGNIFILPPGSRNWDELLPKLERHSLVITTPDQALHSHPLQVINYPNSTPAFVTLTN